MGLKVHQHGFKTINSLNNVQRLHMQLQQNKLNRTTLLTCLSNYELQCQIFNFNSIKKWTSCYLCDIPWSNLGKYHKHNYFSIFNTLVE